MQLAANYERYNLKFLPDFLFVLSHKPQPVFLCQFSFFRAFSKAGKSSSK